MADCKPCYVFIHLQGLGSSQLADHLVNEINQGPCYVKKRFFPRTMSCVNKEVGVHLASNGYHEIAFSLFCVKILGGMHDRY